MTAVLVFGGLCAYAAVAGWVYGRLHDGEEPPRGPHTRDHGPFRGLECHGAKPATLGSAQRCRVCDEAWRARRAALLWPIWWVIQAPVRCFRAAANLQARPKPENEPERTREPTP